MNNARRAAMAAAVLSLAATGLALAAGPASADPTANQEWRTEDGVTFLGDPAGSNYHGHIKTLQNTDKCMAANSTVAQYTNQYSWDGHSVMLWDCWYAPDQSDTYYAQQWTQNDNGDGTWTYNITMPYYGPDTVGPSGWTSVCLDSLGGHAYDGSPVQVFGCNYQDQQRWTIGYSGQLQSVGAGDLGANMCLDDTNWGTTNGSLMQLWQCAY
jgi:hypothetical protein